MTDLTYDLNQAPPRRMGLIVLKTDEVIEREVSEILPVADDVRLHVSRIFFPTDVTSDTLGQMELNLPASASLLPDVPFDVIGYGCTSGATVIGPDRIRDLIATTCDTAAVCDPMTSVIDAAHHLGARKIGVVTPYIPSVSNAICERLEAHDLKISGFGSFGILQDPDVARVTPASIKDAIIGIGRSDCDAVFVSCTNLAVLSVIAEAESAIGKPVLSSNQALAWAMCQSAGIAPKNKFGRLFET